MNRKYQLMQDSLDGELSPEEHEELEGILKTSSEALGEMDGLKAIHRLLERPPHERAPERLAPVIMARIAEMVKEQQRHQTGEAELDEMAEAILNVALATVTVATLPLLVGAGWLMLNRKSSPEALEAVLLQVSALFVMVLDVMQVMLEEAQAAFEDDPETAMVILTLIPVTLLLLVREVLGIEEDTEIDNENENSD